MCGVGSTQMRKCTGSGMRTAWNLKFGSEHFQSLFFLDCETTVLQMKRLGLYQHFSFLFREEIWLSKRKMSFRLWVAVVRAYSVLVMPSKGKIGQQYHTPHQEERKKRGSGETHSSAHKSLNFHKEISCYILQCYLGNHFSVKGTLCLLLFVKLFEPPYLVKGCFTDNLCSI